MEIYRNFTDVQENDKCNFIREARKNHKAVITKSVVCYASK